MKREGGGKGGGQLYFGLGWGKAKSDELDLICQNQKVSLKLQSRFSDFRINVASKTCDMDTHTHNDKHTHIYIPSHKH